MRRHPTGLVLRCGMFVALLRQTVDRGHRAWQQAQRMRRSDSHLPGTAGQTSEAMDAAELGVHGSDAARHTMGPFDAIPKEMGEPAEFLMAAENREHVSRPGGGMCASDCAQSMVCCRSRRRVDGVSDSKSWVFPPRWSKARAHDGDARCSASFDLRADLCRLPGCRSRRSAVTASSAADAAARRSEIGRVARRTVRVRRGRNDTHVRNCRNSPGWRSRPRSADERHHRVSRSG